MIVVAIAGLILVLVLVAAPALQRNGRDIGRRTDATALVGAMAQYLSNNGKLADDVTGMNVVINELELGHYTGSAETTITTSIVSATSYATGDILIGTLHTTAAAQRIILGTTVLPDIDNLHVIISAKCGKLPASDNAKPIIAKYDDTSGGEALLAASHRQYAIMFHLEGESGRYVCLDA